MLRRKLYGPVQGEVKPKPSEKVTGRHQSLSSLSPAKSTEYIDSQVRKYFSGKIQGKYFSSLRSSWLRGMCAALVQSKRVFCGSRETNFSPGQKIFQTFTFDIS